MPRRRSAAVCLVALALLAFASPTAAQKPDALVNRLLIAELGAHSNPSTPVARSIINGLGARFDALALTLLTDAVRHGDYDLQKPALLSLAGMECPEAEALIREYVEVHRLASTARLALEIRPSRLRVKASLRETTPWGPASDGHANCPATSDRP